MDVTAPPMLIYVASPYTGAPGLQRARLGSVQVLMGLLVGLIGEEALFFSPIAHSAGWGDEAASRVYWYAASMWYLDRCDGILVAGMPGHEESIGVGAERARAALNGVPSLILPWPENSDSGAARAFLDEERIREFLASCRRTRTWADRMAEDRGGGGCA